MSPYNHTFMPVDYGAEPFITNIDGISKQNPYYRSALWTGDSLQVTLMSIPVNGEVGLEMHSDFDQFIRIEDGWALVQIGRNKKQLNVQQKVNNNFAIMIPSGTWHNILNIGNTPLKLYSVYAPPHHSFGTVHKTKLESDQEEAHNDLNSCRSSPETRLNNCES